MRLTTNCVLIRRDAYEIAIEDSAAPIHDRMPVFLSPDSIGSWFDGSGSIELLRPASHNVLQVWPVSKRVNRPGNGDVATLIDPIT